MGDNSLKESRRWNANSTIFFTKCSTVYFIVNSPLKADCIVLLFILSIQFTCEKTHDTGVFYNSGQLVSLHKDQRFLQLEISAEIYLLLLLNLNKHWVQFKWPATKYICSAFLESQPWMGRSQPLHTTRWAVADKYGISIMYLDAVLTFYTIVQEAYHVFWLKKLTKHVCIVFDVRGLMPRCRRQWGWAVSSLGSIQRGLSASINVKTLL